MKILVIGGGGREHAILWKLKKDNPDGEYHCAPGNGGISQIAQCHPVKANDVEALVKLALELKSDLVIPGPENPLVAGLVDRLQKEGISTFGPSKKASQIEGSKVFCKRLLLKHGIPTAQLLGKGYYQDPEEARKFICDLFSSETEGCVIKEDGLAAGKGVRICRNRQTALKAIDDFMVKKIHGSAGNEIIIEEILEGPECSIIVVTDLNGTIRAFPASRDHKPRFRLFGRGWGLNTGGMASYSPVAGVTPEYIQEILQTIIKPTISALANEDRPYKGVLYTGLILTSEGLKVLEFNCRFGDPETQVILPLLENNLLELLLAADANDGSLEKIRMSWSDQTAVCVVLASNGYPLQYETGFPIKGLKGFPEERNIIFHAGTAAKDGSFVTAGGRVLGSVGVSPYKTTALHIALKGAEKINFPGKYFIEELGNFVR